MNCMPWNRIADGSWNAGSGAVWDLEGNKFRKNNVTPMWSTDEAGLADLSRTRQV